MERRLREDRLVHGRVDVLQHLGADPARADRVDRDIRAEGKRLAFVSPFMPAFETTYSVNRIADGWYSPEFDDMLTIFPPCWRIMIGATALEHR